MQAARTICNDAGLSLAGNLLADAQPYTLTLVNMAYRTLQEDMTDEGVETMAKEAIIVGLTPITIFDPAIQTSLSFTGYFDGQSNFTSPILPQDMLGPLRLWERPTGSISQFYEMTPTSDGLPTIGQSSCLRYWQWDNDRFYFMGALQSNDLRLRYNVALPDLAFGTNDSSQVMIFRSDRALAYKIAEIFAEARGSELAASFAAKYEHYKEILTGRTARRKQRAQHRRIPYGGRRRSNY